ncbi:MAG: 6-phosphofructokinase, partial [Oscillospiraceae bacterium]
LGLLDGSLFDMKQEKLSELALLEHTPASAFGSCRYRLASFEEDESNYKKILDTFKKFDIRYFFYIGGNDSMDTCMQISRYCEHVGYDCRVIGVPKTIDNDLVGTDHCPGYGSAAKYIATSVAEIALDLEVYRPSSVVVVEIMGRNAGWLAAASALANVGGRGPDLIYLPEVAFDIDRFTQEVADVYSKKGMCLVASSEGVRDGDGKFISQYSSNASGKRDAFGHIQMGGLAPTLTALIRDELKVKARGIELSLLQRCAAHCASQTDIDEACEAGRRAVSFAVEGKTAGMVSYIREGGDRYACGYALTPLEDVANLEKQVPREWINAQGNGVTEDFVKYALPLVQVMPEIPTENGLPRYARLKKNLAEK